MEKLNDNSDMGAKSERITQEKSSFSMSFGSPTSDIRSLFAPVIKRFAHSFQTKSDIQEDGEKSPIRTPVATLSFPNISNSETNSQRPLLSVGAQTPADFGSRLRSRSPNCATSPTPRRRKRSRSESRVRSRDIKFTKLSPGDRRTSGTGAPPRMRSGGVTRFRSGDYSARNRFLNTH